MGLASPSTTRGPIKLTSAELVNSLQGVEAPTTRISAAQLRQLAAQSIADPARSERINRAPVFAQLDQLAQFHHRGFESHSNSARIRSRIPSGTSPASWPTHSILLYLMLHKIIVGYTDGREAGSIISS